MKQITVYSLKIKIVSLHFNIRAISNRLQCHLMLGDKQVDIKQIQVKHGLLNSNVTLQCEVSQKQINLFKEIQLTLAEQNKVDSDLLGNISLTFQEFRNIKMRRFHIRNCFDNSAYLEAFLLLLPVRIIDQSIQQQSQIMTQNLNQHIFQKINEEKHVDMTKDRNYLFEQQEMTFNKLPMTKQLTIQDMTPEVQFDAPPEKQQINTESLIILNEILTQANMQLQIENKSLKEKLEQLGIKISQPNDQTFTLELVQQINHLELKLKTYQQELRQKDIRLLGMEKENDTLKMEIQQLNKSLRSQIKQELNIDNIMSQLGKYSQTIKKYKSKGDSNLKIQPRLTPFPKIPSITINRQFFPKQGSKTYRSSRQTLIQKRKNNLDEFKNDETFDTLKQNSAFTFCL